MTSVLTLSPYLLPLLLLVAALVAGLAWRLISRRGTREMPAERAATGRAPRRPGPAPQETLPGTEDGPEVAEVTPSGWPLTLMAPPARESGSWPPGPPRQAARPTTPPAAEHPPSPLPEATARPLAAATPMAPVAPVAPVVHERRQVLPLPPAAPATGATGATGSFDPAGLPPAPHAPRRTPLPILLVDDSPTVRAALRRCLRNGGHDVLQAGNGQEALSVLHRQRCGLLITDLEMPVMDGVALLRQLQAAGLLEQLPVLAISGHEHASRSLPPDLPIDGVFRKPWSDAELLQRVAELMGLEQDTALRA